jgi:hypothetical protein
MIATLKWQEVPVATAISSLLTEDMRQINVDVSIEA